MRAILIVLLLRVNLVYTATHSLRYVYTGVSGDIDFPEFTAVGLIDGEQFMYFDNKIMKAVPKTDWIRQNEGADYWDRETQGLIGTHQVFKNNIQTAQNRFNQSQGVHTFQEMYGCEWDDQTGATNAFEQYGYDGEDFLSLDFKEMRWISPVLQGMITTQKWNNNMFYLEYYRNYFSTVCIEWLQKYVNYGKSSLEKTVSPQVFLLQKSSSSPVSCHATGFYPSAIKISWMKNGEDHDEDVDLGELLPNEDGTFQRTSTLNIKPEEWKNNQFSCVVEHQGQTKTIPFKTTHSLRYVYTGVSGDIDFPEFTVVGLVDGEQFMYFDSKIMKAVPKTDWIRQNVGADYWDRETQIDIGIHQAFKNNIQIAKERFNQSKGVHTFQEMYGCEWDDQTGATNAFEQFGYDGEDFLSLDFQEMRWISPVLQGFITALKWNNDRADLEYLRHYFSTVCIEWLQKYVKYGKSSLEKTVSPQVSLLKKSSSSPVSCHATGFYPSEIKISWVKNGEDHDEDVDLGELLPNEDGTFQRTSTLDVKPEEWKNNKFGCVVEHQGKIIFPLPLKGFYPSAIKISWRKNGEDHDEDVDLGELLPNERTSTLKVKPEERKNNKFGCVVEHQKQTKAIPLKATHSLRYVYTGVSGDIDFPEFTAVGLVDGEQFMYFDSKIMKAVPKTDWIRQNEGADYWDRETQIDIGTHQAFKNNIQIAKERFNQSRGVHTVQEMYGCEWDDQTGETNGFVQFGYDGEDFLSLDLKEMRWISPVPQGIVTTQRWNYDRGLIESYRNYFSTVCIEWLQKYIKYGKSSLEKTVSPQVSLLKKSSSSPVSCHVTGFYPSAIKISWVKNGEDNDEDVDLGELLPNEDGTFQRTSTLNVKPEEWKNNKFGCVVEHQGQTKTIELKVSDDGSVHTSVAYDTWCARESTHPS